MKQTMIGVECEISQAKNASLCGLSGSVINETRNTITLMTSNGPKRLLRSALALGDDL